MNSILKMGVTRLTNTYHISFHASFYNLVNEAGADQLGIPQNMIEAYKAAIDREQDLVNRSMTSDKTAVIRQHDQERDRLYRFIYNVLTNTENSADPAVVELYATVEAKILSNYSPSISREGDQKETALIRGFLLDIDSFLGNAAVAKLGIREAMNKLAEANEAFQMAYLSRVQEQAESGTGVALECRARTDEQYQSIVTVLNYYASRRDSSDETVMSFYVNCMSFIPNANMLIKRVRAVVKAGRSLSDAASSESGHSGSSSGSSSNSGSKPNSGGSSSGELN